MKIQALAVAAALALAACSSTASYWPGSWFGTSSSTARASQQSLLGTSWVVTDLAGAPAPTDAVMTLNISSDEKINGRAACNGYFGTAHISRSSLRMSGIGSTKMACAEPVMAAETQFLNALNRTRSFSVSEADDRLHLMDSSGAELAVLKRN